MNRVLVFIATACTSLLAVAEPPASPKVSYSFVAPNTLTLTMDSESYLSRRSRQGSATKRVSLGEFQGRTVLLFDYAIGGTCALELVPQPRRDLQPGERQRFQLKNGRVSHSRRGAIGGRCSAMSAHINDWEGELDLRMLANGDLEFDLLLHTYGRNGRNTFSYNAENIISPRVVWKPRPPGMEISTEQGLAILGIVAAAFVLGAGGDYGHTDGSRREADQRIQREQDWAIEQQEHYIREREQAADRAEQPY